MPKMVVATTMTRECESVLRVASGLAERLGSELSVIGSVAELAPGVSARAGHPVLAAVQQWVRDALPAGARIPRVAARGGLPAVEIPRFAEEVNADLLVVGRGRDEGAALADAVLRRSRRPVLVVPCGWTRIEPVLVALDGSERGFQVHQAACELAERIDATVHAVTVEPEDVAGRSAGMHNARSLRLLARVQSCAAAAPGAAALSLHGAPTLHVRTG
ncbi:MAG TPA: universal stress protein, partial [Gemmatimonadales bacterium]|nr:universal stress protein [Gemmatimonadales bacterium]